MGQKSPVETHLLASILCSAFLLTGPGPGAFAAAGQVAWLKVTAPVNAVVGFTGAVPNQNLPIGLGVQQVPLSAGRINPLTPVPSAVVAARQTLPAFSAKPVIAPAEKNEPFLDSEAPFQHVKAVASPSSQTTPELAHLKMLEATPPVRLEAPAARIRTGFFGALEKLVANFAAARGSGSEAQPVASQFFDQAGIGSPVADAFSDRPAAAATGNAQAWRERTDPEGIFPKGPGYIAQRYGSSYDEIGTLNWLKVVSAERFLDDVARDPAMMQHIQDFTEFYKTHPLPQTYAEARGLLSQALGEVTVYRGVALRPEEAQALLREGVRSKARRDRPEDLRHPLSEVFRDHLLHNGANIPDAFISVTSYQDVAAAVAADYAGNGRDVYLLEIRVPELDLIRPRNGAFASFYPWAPSVMRVVVKEPDGDFQFHFLDAKSESVLTYRILPEEIVALRKLEHPPVIDEMLTESE